MAETQQVIVEFIVDDSQLQPAIDKLESTGAIDAKMAAGFKQTNSAINQQANVLKMTAAEFKNTGLSLEQLVAKVKNGNKAFADNEKRLEETEKSLLETKKALEQLKIQYDELNKKLEEHKNKNKGSEDASESLRTKLKNLTQQISLLKLAGQDNTEQFKALVEEAGRLKDAIGDAGKEIEKAASDTELFDNLLGSAQALAGGFAVAQGATALFGNESEELQKTLLKVNAAMAILQGLQQVGNALQKEGAIVQLFSNRLKLINNAQIAIENGLQSTSIIVRLGAAAAQRVLNLAMSANPIGILVVAIAGLITLLATYGRSAATAARQTSTLNVALDQGAKNFEDRADAIKTQGDATINALENQGATGSKIAAQEIANQKLLTDARKERLAELRRLEAENTDADLKKRQELNDAIRKLDDELLTDSLEANNLLAKERKVLNEEELKSRIAASETLLTKAREGSEQQLALQKQLITQRAALELNADGLLAQQRAAIVAKAEQDREAIQIEFNKRQIDLQLKNIEAQLVNVEEGSREEFNLKLKQLKLQSQSEIQSTKLSEAEKKTIREKGFQDQVKLLREFNERQRKEAIEGQISLNNVALNQLKTTEEEKLLLQIDNLSLSAALEIDAAKGNATKIKEINSKLNADILAARKKFLEDELTFALSLQQAREGAERRALERIVNNQKLSIATRKAAIEDLTRKEAEEIDKRLALLEEEKRKKLISEKDYQLQYAQLQDQKKQVTEKSEKDITDLTKQENELRRQVIFEAFNAIQEIFSGLNDLLTSQEEQRIAGQKEQVNALLEAGAITEKEAAARNKRIEADEKRVKREAAQRDKALAIFTAVINTAKAVTSALTAPPPFGQILAAIVGALGAAQIALIASKPIPKFRTGKKNAYEGPGKIGEAGAEIFEHDGKMYLANKETLVWIGKDDKVYTPTETKQMLPQVDHKVINWKPEPKTVELIDYDRLGKAVGKNIIIPGVSVDEDGFKVWQQEGQSRKNYMDKRYSSK